MAEGKKSFVLYVDYLENIKELTDEEAGKLFKHIFAYCNDENPTLDDKLLKLVFNPIKQQLKRDLAKWKDIRSKRVDAGKLGGEASGKSRKQIEANEPSASESKQTEANEAVNVNVKGNNVNGNVDDNETVINKSALDFELFWNEYDKKVDRAKCERKWSKLKEEEKKKCLEYVPAYKVSQPDKKFRRDPATFINNKTWENEIVGETLTRDQKRQKFIDG